MLWLNLLLNSWTWKTKPKLKTNSWTWKPKSKPKILEPERPKKSALVYATLCVRDVPLKNDSGWIFVKWIDKFPSVLFNWLYSFWSSREFLKVWVVQAVERNNSGVSSNSGWIQILKHGLEFGKSLTLMFFKTSLFVHFLLTLNIALVLSTLTLTFVNF